MFIAFIYFALIVEALPVAAISPRGEPQGSGRLPRWAPA
jgi:hypothetical protein